MDRLAVFFPGIGYTVDKPLLHYSRRLAAEHGYETLLLPYSGFPKKVRGDSERMQEACRIALRQAKQMLAGVDFSACDEILFVGKSIGTAVAAKLAAKSDAAPRIRFLLYTPLEETFAFPLGRALVFTGSKDPWVGEGRIPALCAERGLPCRVIPGANHSLETGDVLEDIRNLRQIMAESEAFLRAGL